MYKLTERYLHVLLSIGSVYIAWQTLPSLHVDTLKNALTPIFDLAMFSAGSLFAIYVLALSRGDGFVGRIFNTNTFRQFHKYVSESLFVSVALFVWTASYIIIGFGNFAMNTHLRPQHN